MPNASDTPLPATAAALHADALVVDAHHDILLHVLRRRQAGERGVLSSFWGPRLLAGGVDVQVFPVYLRGDLLPELALRQMLRTIEAFWSDLEEDPGCFAPACSMGEISSAVGQGKVAAILALEGMEGLGNDVEFVSLCYRLGVRMASLTWNRRTAFADGVGETQSGGGLTALGRAAIREMVRLGMVIDVAHLAERGFWDVLEVAEAPVIASHANARALCDHVRNLDDRQLRALAASGGVVGLVLYPGFIDAERPSLARAVDHVAYIADLVGIDHVGLGIDLSMRLLDAASATGGEALVPAEMLEAVVPGLESLERLPYLTAEMQARGFDEAEIRLFLGGNWMRIFEQVLR
jgi:membrane dipeptidase